MKVIVVLVTLAVLANSVHTHSETNTWTSPNEPESHHHHHHHYHRYDQIFGPYVERLLKQLISISKSSNVPCPDNKETESIEKENIEEPLRSNGRADLGPKQIMVVVPSPSGESTWTLDEVTAAIDEPNKEFRESINKAFRIITEKHTTGDLQDFDIFALSGPSMLVPLSLSSTKLMGSPSSPDTIPYAENLRSKLDWPWIWSYGEKNPEPWIIPVSSTNQVDVLDDADNPPELIPYVQPTRRNADKDDVDKKKLHVVIPSPVGARTWTAGELMNAVGILDKSDKYKAVLKRAYDIVKQKIYNGELQNFRTIEVTIPATEMSKWTSVELENALRSRRAMPSSEEISEQPQDNINEGEISNTVASYDILQPTPDHELVAKTKQKCN